MNLKRYILLLIWVITLNTGKSQTSQGTDFWVASTYPFYTTDSFYVAIASEKPTTAYLEIPLIGYKDSVVLGYNQMKYILIPTSIRSSYYYYYSSGSNKIGQNGIHVTSKLPVRVYSFSAGRWYSCGATAVYPTKTQPPGGIYYPYKSRYYWSGGPSSNYKVFFFTVTAIDDSVIVNFKTKTTFMWNLPPGNQLLLRRGQVVRIYTWVQGLDPTLSVEASPGKRIAVFTENFYDYAQSGCFQYDLMYEQILPSNVLGSDFILTPYMYHKKGYDFTITAMDSNTIVKKDGVPFDTLNSGEAYYGRIYTDSSVNITSDKPVNCWQKNILDTCTSGGWGWFSGPSIMTISTSEQMISDATVSVPESSNFSDNYINIITSKFGRDSTWLDGNLLLPNEFVPILNSKFYLYRDTILRGNHRITGPYGFISYIYGRGLYGGYAYNASAGLQSLKRIILSETFKSCDTGKIVKLTSQGDPAKNFQWEFNGKTDTGLTAWFYVKKDGLYPVKLKYQLLRNNYWDSVMSFVQVKGNEVLDFIKGLEQNVCKTSFTITLPKSKLFNYLWNTGSTSNTITTTSNQTFTVIITNTETGCKFYDTAIVALYDKLTPDFSVSMARRCPGYPIYMQNLSTLGKNDSIIKYQWYVDNLPNSNSKNDTVKYAYPGTYDLRLVITSKSGCKDSVTKEIKVQDNPELVIGTRVFDSCYQSSNIRFNSRSSLTVGKITGYQWIFSDGDTTYKKQQAIRNIRDSGMHWVQFAAFSDAGCSDTTDKLYFKIHSAPSPDFSVIDSSVCTSGNYFSVDNLSNTYGQKARYEWQWGDGTGETYEEPGYKNYSDTGTYTIALVSAYLSTGCADTFRRTVRVLPNPVAKLSLDSSNFCLNNNYFHFSDQSDARGGLNRYVTWNWGDGTSNDTAAMSKTYSKDGTFKVKMYFSTGKGCLDSAQKNVVVYKSPIAAFAVTDSNICGNKNYFDIVNNSTAPVNAKWLWLWGNGLNSTSKNPGKLSYSFYGTYQASLIVTDPLTGCTDTSRRTFLVLKGPEMNVVVSDTVVCDINSLVSFKDSTDYGNITPKRLWVFNNNDADTTTARSFSKQFKTQGYQNVKMTGGLPGVCTDTFSKNILVRYTDSVASFSSQLHYQCAPASADFKANPKFAGSWKYEWDMGSGSFSTGNDNPKNIPFNNSGTYTVRLKITDDLNCEYGSSKDFTIYKNPKTVLSNLSSDTQCLKGNKFSFSGNYTDTFSRVVFSWNLDEGNSSNSSVPPLITYSSSGNKTVKLKITDGHLCVDSSQKTIFVNESPRVTLTGGNICLGQSFLLKPIITPASVVIENINWFENNIPVGNGSQYLYKPLTSGTGVFRVVVNAAGDCRDTSNVVSVIVYDSPDARFGVDMKAATSAGVRVAFLDSSNGATKWTWYPDLPYTHIKSNNLIFDYLYPRLGKVNTRLVVENQHGCKDSLDKELNLISDELLFMPSSFTPNGDNRNDRFKPSQLSAVSLYEFSIYNRWGQKLFFSTDPEMGWDGNFNGQPVPQGAYAYSVNVIFLTGNRHVLHGNVTIIR